MVLGHRGGDGPWRENSLEAFGGALDLGADGVELDVRRTVDGRLVVHHDAEIAGLGPLHSLRADQLPAWLPGLDQALASCAGAVVNVEIKNTPLEPGFDPEEAMAVEVVAAVKESRPGPDRVIVSSFWPANLEAVRRADPGLATGLLVHPALDAREMAGQAQALGCLALHPFHARVSPELVEELHQMGLAVMTWTVNEPAEVTAMARAGVDGIITDRVSSSLAALDRS
jgi:glycerophosphoryl diester phosphodiesterase